MDVINWHDKSATTVVLLGQRYGDLVGSQPNSPFEYVRELGDKPVLEITKVKNTLRTLSNVPAIYVIGFRPMIFLKLVPEYILSI